MLAQAGADCAGRPSPRDLSDRTKEAAIRRARTLLIAALSVALVGAAGAPALAAPTGATYRVDCSAKSSGNGITTPWRSLGAVNNHGAFAPGDRILFKRGTTCKGRLFPSGNGVAGASIVLDAYGTGAKPTIAGGGTGSKTGAVSLRNPQYWTVQNLHVTNRSKASSTTTFRSGVLLVNDNGGMLPGVVLQHLVVDNVTSKLLYQKRYDARDWGGISAQTVDRGNGDGFEGLRIVNNVITGVGRTGIVTSNREYPDGLDHNLRIAGNKIVKTRGDGIIMRGARNARIDHNRIKDASNMWPCPQCLKQAGMGANAGIWPTWSSDSYVEYNNISGTHVGHGDGEGIDLDIMAERIYVQYNYLHDNDGGGVLFCGSKNSVARFNIMENNKKSAIAFIGSVPAKGSQVYNNTIYASKKAQARPVRYFNGRHGSGITFKNNIVYNYGISSWLWPTKPTTAANTLVGLHKAGRPTGHGTSLKNPQLKNPGTGATSFASLKGYKPKHPSSFKRGVAIPKDVTHDFFGKKIDPAKPPRGAAG